MTRFRPPVKVPVPIFRSSEPINADRSVPTISPRTNILNTQHMIRSAVASNLRRNSELVTELYANCERAPFGWELRDRQALGGTNAK